MRKIICSVGMLFMFAQVKGDDIDASEKNDLLKKGLSGFYLALGGGYSSTKVRQESCFMMFDTGTEPGTTGMRGRTKEQILAFVGSKTEVRSLAFIGGSGWSANPTVEDIRARIEVNDGNKYRTEFQSWGGNPANIDGVLLNAYAAKVHNEEKTLVTGTLIADGSKVIRTESDGGGALMGAVAFGYGAFIGNVMVAAEGIADFSGKHTTKMEYNNCESGGFSPSLKLRLGYFMESIGGTVYTSFGMSQLRVKCVGTEVLEGSSFTATQLTPTIGVGFEKAFGNKCSLKLEYDYKIPYKKIGYLKVKDAHNFYVGDDGPTDMSLPIKTQNRSHLARVMVCYHI